MIILKFKDILFNKTAPTVFYLIGTAEIIVFLVVFLPKRNTSDCFLMPVNVNYSTTPLKYIH